MDDDESSFSDWESAHGDGDVPGGSTEERQIILDLPTEVFTRSVAASDAEAAAGPTNKSGSDDFAACSLISSFVSVSQFDNMSMQSKKLPSTSSSYEYKSKSEESSLLSNFDILSLSSGVVRQCKRCKFHNKHDSVVCAACELALVANPNVDIDAQISLNLQQKEEQNARTMLQEAERKRNQLHQHPLYEFSCILTDDLKKACASLQTLPTEDLEGLVLTFIKQAMDLPEPKNILLAFKCTPYSSLELIRTGGLPADQKLGMTSCKVEVSGSLEDALAAHNAQRICHGHPLCFIPENRIDDMEHLNPSCLCWVVAVVQSTDSSENLGAYSPKQTLPFAYFDSYRADVGDLNNIFHSLQTTFSDFVSANLNLPVSFNLSWHPKNKLKQHDGSSQQVRYGGLDGIIASSSLAKSAHMKTIPNETVMLEGFPHVMESASDGVGGASSAFSPVPSTTTNASEITTPNRSPASYQVNVLPGDPSIDNNITNKKGTTYIWDKAIKSLKMKDRITVIEAFGSSVAICCNGQDILLWNEHSGIYKTLKRASDTVSCLTSTASVLSDGYLFASGDVSGVVVVYTLVSGSSGDTYDDAKLVFDSGQPRRDAGALNYKFLSATPPAIMDLRFLPEGTALAAMNSKMECQLWSLDDNSCLCSLKDDQLQPCDGLQLAVACFSPDGNSLASVIEGSRFIHFWKSNGVRQQLTGHVSSPDTIGRQEYRIRCLSFSADEKHLASAANDCTIRLWDIQNDDSPCIKIIHVPVAITSLKFSPDSSLIAAGCVNGAVRVWNVITNRDEAVKTFVVGTGSVKSLVFLPDGKTLVSTGLYDHNLWFWDLEL